MKQRWIEYLDDEDLAFLRRFLLASGTLKELAAVYEISYPTVRLRLDRLIEKVKVIERDPTLSPFETRLRATYADGGMDAQTFSSLLEAYHEEEKQNA